MTLQGEADVVLLPGTRTALHELTGQTKAIEAFTARGGWILLQDLDPKAISLLSKLVGEELIYRPVRQERITVVRRDDPLMAGIGNHELYWDVTMNETTARKNMWLFGDRPLRDDVFTGAILDDDVCGLTGNAALSNGLTSDDSWKYIAYTGDDPIRLDWGRPMEICKVAVRENRHYKRMEEITLRLGDDPAGEIKLPVPKERQRLVFEFAPRTIRSISLQATKFVTLKSGPMGWDKVEIYRVLPESFHKRVVPLTRPAGIVKFPMGKGGILLNMTSVDDQRGVRVLMQLLNNLGVGRSPAPEAEGLMDLK